MAENKTINPQENIKLLHNYKGDKLASLMQEVSQEKNRALTLKNSIKAKIAQLREIALEKECKTVYAILWIVFFRSKIVEIVICLVTVESVEIHSLVIDKCCCSTPANSGNKELIVVVYNK